MILIVDGKRAMAESSADLVSSAGYEVKIETNPYKVEAIVSNDANIKFIFLDLMMPKMDGIQVLQRVKLIRPDIGVVILTVVNQIDKCVEAVRQGAYNYLLKPSKQEAIERVLHSYFKNIPKSIVDNEKFFKFVTNDQKFREIFRKVNIYAEADVPILITGETGTGKGIMAEIVHSLNRRVNQPFTYLNVGSVPEPLFESELFGHAKGAFTGANADRAGYMEIAGEGTLFLDEVGEINENVQKKLLHVIQNQEFTRVGERTPRPLKARIIFATNRNLWKSVQMGKFREDLFFRITGYQIDLPPLTERDGDIELLTKFFFNKYNCQYGRELDGISEEAMQVLKEYNFPGNVRELETIVSAAVLIEQERELQLSTLPEYVRKKGRTKGGKIFRLFGNKAI